MAGETAVALTIAGSDPSGGAGIQADLKTFHQFGVYGEAVVTLLTVQNTTRVSRVDLVDVDLVTEQIQAVLEDIPPQAAKTGALGDGEMIRAIAALARDFQFPLVVDPVMISKQGAILLEDDAAHTLRRELVPRSFLITPNLPEAAALTGVEVHNIEKMKEAAQKLFDMGAKNVLVKGGHLQEDATDVLFCDELWYYFPAPHLDTKHTHGTGCTYSAAITAGLALGWTLPHAVETAKDFIHHAIRTAPLLGKGAGPVNHHARLTRE
ncbi:MAG: bifunctional hydroxymethylpyrimidine kinase/phosphomethylpyrimidine kinase [Acidobacteriaceae bacterium]|nr:bifunctional hydroxymethylpyrimidine kinase/phosphomethylpyrimidine kinase [Acidobacteriaceae bacterium]